MGKGLDSLLNKAIIATATLAIASGALLYHRNYQRTYKSTEAMGIETALIPEGVMEVGTPEETAKVERVPVQRKLAVGGKKVIVLDPGHGMGNRKKGVYDPGAVYSGLEEAELVLWQARYAKDYLESRGYVVYLTRQDDETPAPLNYRAGIADRRHADVFVSIHCNASLTPARGPETFYGGEESIKLAETIQSTLMDELKSPSNRAVKPGGFKVLQQMNTCALVEPGFLSSPEDRAYLKDTRRVGEAIGKGIANYFEGKPTPKNRTTNRKKSS